MGFLGERCLDIRCRSRLRATAAAICWAPSFLRQRRRSSSEALPELIGLAAAAKSLAGQDEDMVKIDGLGDEAEGKGADRQEAGC